MKKVLFAITFAIASVFSANAANLPQTTVTETETTITTRTVSEVKILDEAFWKITITIHFKKFDVVITIEGLMAPGGNGDTNSTVEADAQLRNGMLDFTLPESVRKQLDPNAPIKIVRGGVFKAADGTTYDLKSNTVAKMGVNGKLTYQNRSKTSEAKNTIGD